MKKILFFCLFLMFWLHARELVCSKVKWQEKKTLHFIILFRDAPLDFIKNVEDTAERCYDETIRDLGFYRSFKAIDDDRIKIYIFDDINDFNTQTSEKDGIHGVAYFRQRTIRTFPSAHGFFDSTLPHELGHIIFREFIGHDRNIPLWLDEGVAMYQEKAKRWGAHEAVRQAIRQKRFIPLKEFSRMRVKDFKSREEMSLFYAQAASLVYFMIRELGQYRFLTLCNQLRTGTDFDKAFKSAYRQFDDLEDLEEAWMGYLEGKEK